MHTADSITEDIKLHSTKIVYLNIHSVRCLCPRLKNLKPVSVQEPLTKLDFFSLSFLFFPTVIVVLFVTLRRHKNEPLIIKDDEDVRENIIRYDDEGGGEEDTEAFDIATLQNPDGINGYLPRKDIKPDLQFMPRAGQHSGPNGVDVDEFINVRLHEADNDPTAPPYDSIQIYGYEGRGSIAGSLSSLETTSSDSDQNYDYLREWGPRFRRLGELYSVGESDRETWSLVC